jgi:hypothetical protein
MNQDSENFDSLRQLLALKRHEIPPPGYFDRLPRDIMARIKSGDTGQEFGGESSWLHRLLGVFDLKPIFAGAFGTAVCAFLVSGVISSEQSPGIPSVNADPANSPAGAVPIPTGFANAGIGENFSTSSNVMAGGSLFDRFSLPVTPANYSLSGGQ